jgi:hypothetical protein
MDKQPALEPRIEAEYFYRPEGSPKLWVLLAGLSGICTTLEAMTYNLDLNDWEEIERLGDLGIAASILTRQLRNRHHVGKPSKRRKPKPKLEVVA